MKNQPDWLERKLYRLLRFDAEQREALRVIRPLLVGTVVLTFVHWLSLTLQVPFNLLWPLWYWNPTGNPPGAPGILLALLALCAGVIWVVSREWTRPWRAVALLILLGYGGQHGLALTEGRGLEGMRDSLVRGTHAEFLTIAVQQPSLWSAMSEYENKIAAGELGRYARSKPAGQLLLYMASQRLADRLAPRADAAAKLEAARTFCALLWPLASYLILIPLFGIVSTLSSQAHALRACGLYLFIPSTALITLHADQAFFGLFFLLPIWLLLRSVERERPAWAVMAGAATAGAAFCSFPLVAALPFGSAVVLGRTWERGDERPFLKWARLTALAGGGALGTALLIEQLLGFDFRLRFERAIAHHSNWKVDVPGSGGMIELGLLNLSEYALWLGVPVAVLVAVQVRRGLKRACHGKADGLGALSISLVVSVAVLAFAAETEGEVARLWLFLTPIAVALACEVFEHELARVRRTLFPALILAQWVTVYLTKRFQDF